MSNLHRTVDSIPLEQLWNENGNLNALRIRHLSSDDIAELINSNLTFVVAEPGQALNWIESADTINFWNTEVKDRIVYPDDEIILDDYPDAYCYAASEWSPFPGGLLILLEKYQ